MPSTSSRTARLSPSSTDVSSLNICSFNARSVRHKLTEICDFGQTNFINIFAVSEFWLGPTMPDNMLNLPGFQQYREDRNASGGAVCFFIKNDLPCRRRTDLEFLRLQLIWIEAFLKSFSLLVGCCYRPPSSATVFYEMVEKSLDAASKQNVVLVGDFNAKHFCGWKPIRLIKLEIFLRTSLTVST